MLHLTGLLATQLGSGVSEGEKSKCFLNQWRICSTLTGHRALFVFLWMNQVDEKIGWPIDYTGGSILSPCLRVLVHLFLPYSITGPDGRLHPL